jgi:hypothetical protein
MSPRGRIVVVRITGEVDREAIAGDPGAFEGFAAQCLSTGCRGILIDVRGLVLRLDREDLRALAEALAAARLPGVKVAAVVDPEHMLPDRMFREVARARGAELGIFLHEEEAAACINGEA